jgi:hypothetical protein
LEDVLLSLLKDVALEFDALSTENEGNEPLPEVIEPLQLGELLEEGTSALLPLPSACRHFADVGEAALSVENGDELLVEYGGELLQEEAAPPDGDELLEPQELVNLSTVI